MKKALWLVPLSLLLTLVLTLATSVGAQADIKVTSVTITPDSVKEGEVVTITATVTNTGDAPGSYTLALKINDEVEATKEIVDLAADASQTVAFTVTKDMAGDYIVDLNGFPGYFSVIGSYASQLLSPNNGCIGCPVSPASFSWSPFKGTTSYKFQLASDAAMTSIVAEDTVPTTAYECSGTLDYSTNYFWRVMSVEPAPSDWSATFSFQTAPAPEEAPALPPPSVTTDDASNITVTEARLNANLTDLGGAAAIEVSFEWGTTQGEPYPNETTPQRMTAVGDFHFGVGSLNPRGTYYFRAKAVGDCEAYGDEKSFTTGTIQPSVATGDVTIITTTKARLSGSLTDLGTASVVHVSFQWGTGSEGFAYETASQVMGTTGSFGANLTALAPATAFHFRAKAVGDGTSYGTASSFLTKAEPAPQPTHKAVPPASAKESEGCFIATAAYGTPTAQEIDVLREFRDEVLLSSRLGGRLVSFYYRTSPAVANFICQHQTLRIVVREAFVDPLVWIVKATTLVLQD